MSGESPLQKAPDGLLGALDLKTLGRSPFLFPAELQATLEATPYYLLRNRKQQSVTVTVSGINVTLTAWTVPQDEVWRLKAVSVVLSRNVADIALVPDFGVIIRRATSTSTTCLFSAIFPATIATDLIQQRGFVLPEPLWMGPGDRVALQTSTTQNAANSASLQTDHDVVASG
jgi:hypothetical protein